MTVRELRAIAENCWFTLVDNVNEGKYGEIVIIWEESENKPIPEDYLNLKVEWFTPENRCINCFVTV